MGLRHTMSNPDLCLNRSAFSYFQGIMETYVKMKTSVSCQRCVSMECVFGTMKMLPTAVTVSRVGMQRTVPNMTPATTSLASTVRRANGSITQCSRASVHEDFRV